MFVQPPVAETEPVFEPEPAAVAEPHVEPVFDPAFEPGPIVAPEPEPEPVLSAAPEPAPAAESEPAFEAAGAPDAPAAPTQDARPQLTPAAIDRIEMPAWPTPLRPPLSDSAPIPPAVSPFPPAQVPGPPVVPQWPAPLRPDLDVSSTPFWASGGSGIDPGADVWSASAREVAGVPGQAVSAVGVQSCVSCGLSLSATARFCRRCGSRQG